MQLNSRETDIPLFIRRLMPNATARELESADTVYKDYVLFVLRLNRHLCAAIPPEDSPDLEDRDRFKNVARN